MEKTYYLGIDICGTKCTVLAGNNQMEIMDRIQFPTETPKGPDYAIAKLFEAASKLKSKYSDQKLLAIGISCGGPLDSKKGIILSPPNLPGWDEIPITEMFQEEFKVRVEVQNDANACALAEWIMGAGKSTRNMIFLTFGTGMGSGLILNSQLYAGTNDLGGEVGHVRMANDGPVGFGKAGSFEGFCSGGGIAQLAKSMSGKDKDAREVAIAASDVEPGALEQCRILPSELGDSIGDYAALSVAKNICL